LKDVEKRLAALAKAFNAVDFINTIQHISTHCFYPRPSGKR